MHVGVRGQSVMFSLFCLSCCGQSTVSYVVELVQQNMASAFIGQFISIFCARIIVIFLNVYSKGSMIFCGNE